MGPERKSEARSRRGKSVCSDPNELARICPMSRENRVRHLNGLESRHFDDFGQFAFRPVQSADIWQTLLGQLSVYRGQPILKLPRMRRDGCWSAKIHHIWE
jgi:hypothetical protein